MPPKTAVAEEQSAVFDDDESREPGPPPGTLEGEFVADPFDLEEDLADLPGVGEQGLRESEVPEPPPAANIEDGDTEEVDFGGSAPAKTPAAPASTGDAELQARIAQLDESNRKLAATVDTLLEDRQRQQEATYEQEVERHKAQLDETREQLKQAIADGDPVAQLKATDRLTDLKADVPKKPAASAPVEAPAPAAATPPPMVRAFMAANSWVTDGTAPDLADDLHAMHRRLERRGLQLSDPRYFEELTAGLRERNPELANRVVNPHTTSTTTHRESPAHGGRDVTTGGSNRKPRANSKAITAADIKLMRDFGMDPAKPRTLDVYLRCRDEQREKEAQGEMRGRM